MSEFNIEVEGGSSVRLPTAGKYCDRDIVVTAKGGGEEIYFSKHGAGYTADMVLDCTVIIGGLWNGADNLKSLELTEWNPTSAVNIPLAGGSITDTFRSTSLETLLLPKLQYGGHYWARNATGLKTVQLGSIGYPVVIGLGYFFYGCEQGDLTITVYVNALTIEEANAIVVGAPWRATNATIVYRNSTTGEVITE